MSKLKSHKTVALISLNKWFLTANCPCFAANSPELKTLISFS